MSEKLATNLIGKRVLLEHPCVTRGVMRSYHEAAIQAEKDAGKLPAWHGQRGEVCTGSLDGESTPVYEVLLDSGEIVGQIYSIYMRVCK